MKPKIRIAKNGSSALSNSISLQRNDKILFEGYTEIKEIQEEMSRISLKI